MDLTSKKRENRPIVTDKPVEIAKKPVEVQDFKKKLVRDDPKLLDDGGEIPTSYGRG